MATYDSHHTPFPLLQELDMKKAYVDTVYITAGFND